MGSTTDKTGMVTETLIVGGFAANRGTCDSLNSAMIGVAVNAVIADDAMLKMSSRDEDERRNVLTGTCIG